MFRGSTVFRLDCISILMPEFSRVGIPVCCKAFYFIIIVAVVSLRNFIVLGIIIGGGRVND